MNFRRATTKDLEAIHVLLKQSDLPFEDCHEHLEDFLVLELEEQIIAVGGLELYSEYALLRSVAVDSAYRAKGLGGMMFLQLKQLAVKRGVKEMYLLTETAEQYFEKFKFVAVSRDVVPEAIQRTEQFSSLCPASAVVMKRVL